ncbi:hypothetical protein EXIGLDRAFT_603024, partial [Exidia glandulosa HHB12029]
MNIPVNARKTVVRCILSPVSLAANSQWSLDSFQTAFYLHLRILWGIIEVTDIPEPPDVDTLETFGQRFQDVDEVIETRNIHVHVPAANNAMLERMKKLRGDPSSASKNAKQAARISDVVLGYFFALLTLFKLRRFNPDFRQSPSSTYNLAHRLIAIDTWRQALAAGAYDSMGANKALIDDFLLWIRCADHFIHFYIFHIYEREQKYPGITVEIQERANRRGRQQRLARGRVEWLKTAQYPKRVLDLIGNIDGTSDDE